MEVHGSNLALFEKPLVESAVDSIDWIHHAPVSIPNKNAALVFDIPGSTNLYTDLGKSLLRLKVNVTLEDGSALKQEDLVALSNLGLSTIFSQVDVSLNQKVITTSVGSNYPYKAYMDVLLNSTNEECQSSLQTELFYKDTAGSMEGVGVKGGNMGHYNRMLHTNQSQMLILEGGIRMDICQQERLITIGVGICIKMSQKEDSFRLTAEGDKKYKLNIQDAVLKVCRVSLRSDIFVALGNTIKTKPALYPFWQSDIKTYTLQKGISDYSESDVYRGSVPSVLALALCSSEAFNGDYNKNPFNFQHYNVNYIEVTVDGISVPSEPLKPNFKEMDYTSVY